MSDERRKHPRIAVKEADLRVSQVAQFEVLSIVDFSVGGIKLEITEPTNKVVDGTQLDVTLEWEGGTSIFNAQVRHVSQVDGAPGRIYLGIEFDDPDLVEELLGPWYEDEITRL